MVVYGILFGGMHLVEFISIIYIDWNVLCISYSPQCYYGRLWDFIWWNAPYMLNIQWTLHKLHKYVFNNKQNWSPIACHPQEFLMPGFHNCVKGWENFSTFWES